MVLRCLVVAVVVCRAAAALAEAPRFDAYAVHVSPGNVHAGVSLSDPKSRQYSDELESVEGQPVNFAGHFVLATWGCGASCVMGAAVDLRTGAVSWLPFTVCCWSRDITEPLDYKPNSRLLVVHGSRNEEGTGTHAYVFDGEVFTLLEVGGDTDPR